LGPDEVGEGGPSVGEGAAGSMRAESAARRPKMRNVGAPTPTWACMLDMSGGAAKRAKALRRARKVRVFLRSYARAAIA
jgi:hypothetical protein